MWNKKGRVYLVGILMGIIVLLYGIRWYFGSQPAGHSEPDKNQTVNTFNIQQIYAEIAEDIQ